MGRLFACPLRPAAPQPHRPATAPHRSRPRAAPVAAARLVSSVPSPGLRSSKQVTRRAIRVPGLRP
ncbi:hypothetical protein CRI70_00595 [Streptomyces sp. Ru87]|nr:hypothetical protein CRI70_00595 [Streptomyces sp. Ru87]